MWVPRWWCGRGVVYIKLYIIHQNMANMAGSMEQEAFLCRRCRLQLFTSADLMDHLPKRHEISTRKKLKDAKQNQVADSCSSFFLAETLPWMDESHLAEGKLFCPNLKCRTRLGAMNWAGSQCSCGTWVTPSIQIPKSRVDKKFDASQIPIVNGAVVPTDATMQPAPSQQQGEDQGAEPDHVQEAA